MSGVAGLVRLDGAPAASEEVARMLARLAHRGPDGAGVRGAGPAVLGHRWLASVATARAARQPLASADGTLVVTADARLDNHAELAAALDRPRATGDAALILAAYARWGERCPEHLEGDFAFALWDARRQVLFCARDRFGVRPFYYYHAPGRCLAFASEIKGLLALPEVPQRLDETRVADYLSGLFEDTARTFYEGVLRLPPAHRLSAGPGGVRLARYWALDPAGEIHLGSDRDYAAAFLELFTAAVRGRLRGPDPVGAMLSGGLDSSSIAAVARRLLAHAGRGPLHTLSVVFPDLPECDERPYIAAVVAEGGVAPHYVRGDQLSPLDHLDRTLAQQDEPFYAPNLFLHEALYRAAAAAGIRVVLDGLDGDTTVSHGLGSLHELARRGRWRRLAREVQALAARLGRPPLGIWRTQIAAPFVPGALRRAWARLRGREVRAGAPPALVRPDFARRIGLAERAAAQQARWRLPWRTARAEHHCRLTTGLIPFVLEVADRCAAAAGLEPRYPFFDRRLAELCLAFPADQKLRHGWTRFVLRAAMQGILPSVVQWRAGKADLGPSFAARLGSPAARAVARAALGAGTRLREYVSLGPGDALPSDPMTLWKLIVLARWLDTRAPGSPVRGGHRHESQSAGPAEAAGAGASAAAPSVCPA